MIGWVICLGCLQIPPSRQPHSPDRLPAVSHSWGTLLHLLIQDRLPPPRSKLSPMKGSLLSGIRFIGRSLRPTAFKEPGRKSCFYVCQVSLTVTPTTKVFLVLQHSNSKQKSSAWWLRFSFLLYQQVAVRC